MRTEGTEATSRRERLLIRREELEQLELLARSEHGVLLHRPRPQRPRGEGRHVRRVQTKDAYLYLRESEFSLQRLTRAGT